ncbi:anti-sigma factor domain-containing protein [Amycolatopsis sp. NPDC058986]|uniref:anti-sigma factor n=1 Tax=unclassified Amycolatopsis TaxID=2618356 RepID=UPI00366DAEBE
MTSPEMHTLAGAFALDAVSDVERAEFRRHLEQCESCALEVRELRATAARLGMAMAEPPPPALKHRVLATMHATRQLSPSGRRDPADEPPPRRAGKASRWGVAAAVIGFALAGVGGAVAYTQNQDLVAARQELDRTKAAYAPVSRVLAAPDAKTGHGSASIGGGGTVVASRSMDQLVFMDTGLPPRPPGRVYQAWLMPSAGAPRPAGLLNDGPTGSMIVANGLRGAEKVALSIERAGGSTTGAPSADVVLVMPMPG